LVLLPFLFNGICAQVVPYHIDNAQLYDFLDELANVGAIDVSSVVKPWSRKEIADFLVQAQSHSGLNRRQKQEIIFYLKDFNKELTVGKDFSRRLDLLYYSDSLFQFTLNPILGITTMHNGNALEYHRWNGAEFHGYIGKHVGFYGSLRDNHESTVLGGREMLTRHRGAIYKGDQEAKDYSEARGGITVSWEWGSIGLLKDHFTFGSGYNEATILSAHTPSFAHLSFKMNPVHWLEFNYVHGWLVSEVVDSSRSYNYYDDVREVYANKYIAANVFTFKPWKKLHLSVGNSIVYGDVDVNPAYLIPFMFYKSVDHTYNSGSNQVGHNAQMYLDISSRQINKVHLYSTLFVDEISFSRLFDAQQQSNYLSFRAGFRVTDLLPNTSFTAEYTRANPMVYQHIIPTTTYESNGYTMGHYLNDNADEFYLSFRYKPIRGLQVQLDWLHVRKGKDYQGIIRDGDEEEHPEINPEEPRWGLPFMREVRYQKQQYKVALVYQIINDGYVFGEVCGNTLEGSDQERYTPIYYQEGNPVFSFGVNFGF
jgi:hypothetical protein